MAQSSDPYLPGAGVQGIVPGRAREIDGGRACQEGREEGAPFGTTRAVGPLRRTSVPDPVHPPPPPHLGCLVQDHPPRPGRPTRRWSRGATEPPAPFMPWSSLPRQGSSECDGGPVFVAPSSCSRRRCRPLPGLCCGCGLMVLGFTTWLHCCLGLSLGSAYSAFHVLAVWC